MNELIPPEVTAELEYMGQRYAELQRAVSSKQWFFGEKVNELWQSLPPEAREELSLEQFCMECSSHINKRLDFPVVGDSGRTLRYWCEVAKHYESFPELKAWRKVLSFDHFAKAKGLGADPTNDVTSDEALARAIRNQWTADEMKAALTSKVTLTPEQQAIADKYPQWARQTAYALIGLNGTREQAEKHYTAFVRLVESERKK